MREFISKLTFGFFMAQLFPGALVVFSITCPFKIEENKNLCEYFISIIGDFWFESTMKIAIFLILSVAMGMIIHGLHWAIVAWIENKSGRSVRESFWHKYTMWKQVLLSPIKMILEMLWLLVAPEIDKLTMEENVTKIKEQDMPKFIFLQEFYLYFAQFYAHTAYALLFSIPFIFWTVCKIGITKQRILFLAFLYFLTSAFFLLGRIQLGSLFKAEQSLTGHAEEGEGKKTPGSR